MADVQLDGFVKAVRNVSGDARVALKQDKTGVTADSGRMVRWIGSFRSTSNRLATAAFADSLRSQYGDELAGLALKSAGLSGTLKRGKPLQARQVEAAVQQAESLKVSFRRNSALVAREISQRVFGSHMGPRFLANKAVQVARETMPHGTFIAQRLDAAALSKTVESAIVDASKGGSHLVTTEEAAKIQERVIGKELDAARLNLARAAEARLDVDKPESVTRRLFERAASAIDGAPKLRFDSLSDDARGVLSERLQHEVIGPATRPRSEGVGVLRDDAALEQAVDRVVRDFVNERVAARDAVNGLPIPDQAKAAMVERALHEPVAPQLARAFAEAYAELEGPTRILGEPRGADRQQALSQFHDALDHAIRRADFSIDSNNRMAVCGAFWQMMLAPVGDAQVEAVGENLKAGGDLRDFHAGVRYFRHVLAAEAMFLERSPREGGGLVFPPESFERASKYDTLMESLGLVVERKLGAESMQLRADEPEAEVPDATVTTMRNLGMPMPAPLRVNAEGSDVPISDPTRRAIEALVDQHVKNTDAQPLTDGVTDLARRDFNRAAYVIDGTTMPQDTDEVTEGLRQLCVGRDGEPNPKMLHRVSGFANQGGIGCAYARCVGSADWLDVALVGGLPLDSDPKALTYTLTSDRSTGDILLHMSHRVHTNAIAVPAGEAEPGLVFLDVDRSAYAIEMTLRFDAQTCDPKVEQLRFDYAFHEPDPQPA